MATGSGSGEEEKVAIAQTSPAYLKSNATSHPWAFSAIAELVDNAYDPDVCAKHLEISFVKAGSEQVECLQFTDDGNGMDNAQLFRLLSFGFSDKKDLEGHKAIGRYGNGFKSGSMRLGRDAIVFTRENRTKTGSVGFLSQTYLEGHDVIRVPIVSWKFGEETKAPEAIIGDDDIAHANLSVITKYSPFKTCQDLTGELMTSGQRGRTDHGTKIIIFNLNQEHFEDSDESELTFSNADITNTRAHEYEPEYRKSLRKYLSILYLRPKLAIWLLGKKVRSRLIDKDITRQKEDSYLPQAPQKLQNDRAKFLWKKHNTINIKFGYTKKSLDMADYGLMMYHRNRLIKGYEKVGHQVRPQNGIGVGVVGVVEVDCLTPSHIKQDFTHDKKYQRLIHNLGIKLNDYWIETNQGPSSTSQADEKLDTWAQCDSCNKWRRLGDIPESDLPDDWVCSQNPDLFHNQCDHPEEEENERGDVGRRTYQKSVKLRKKKEQANKRRHMEDSFNSTKQENEQLVKRQRRHNKRMETQRDNVRQLNCLVARMCGSFPDHIITEVVDEVHQFYVRCSRCSADRIVPENMPVVDREHWLCSDGHFHCNDNVQAIRCVLCNKKRFLQPDSKIPARFIDNWHCSVQEEGIRYNSCEDPEEQMGRPDPSTSPVTEVVDLTSAEYESDDDEEDDIDIKFQEMNAEVCGVRRAVELANRVIKNSAPVVKIEKSTIECQTDSNDEQSQLNSGELETLRAENERLKADNDHQALEIDQLSTSAAQYMQDKIKLEELARQAITQIFQNNTDGSVFTVSPDVSAEELLETLITQTAAMPDSDYKMQ